MPLSTALRTWFQANHRDLPWRRTRDPYRIWISEIMLQQTTVNVVIPYYEAFLKGFPTVEILAKAREEKVLSLWSGLGYYSRARNLQKAAKEIVKLKKFPQTYAQLLELPGIGPYTAAAIASFAFNESVACVDGNVIRVITRLFDIDEDIATKSAKEKIAAHAQSLIEGQDPHDHNQAMMELGATICTPQNPTCLLCPISKFCASKQNGTQLSRPVKTKNKKQEPWLWKLYVVEKEGRIALVKNENGTPWLNHLWILPGEAAPLEVQKSAIQPTHAFKHSITHHKIFVQVLKGSKKEITKLESKGEHVKVKWIKPAEMKKLGVSSVIQKAVNVWNQASTSYQENHRADYLKRNN